MKYFVILLIMVGMIIPSLSSNGYAICADESLEWWEPCNDTGKFTDGIYIKYSILIPVFLIIMGGIIFVIWRKRK